jgi:TonB family protein
MSLEQAGNAFDLLGQAATLAGSVRLPRGNSPKLEIGWGSFHQGIGSSIAALLTRAKIPKNLAIAYFFTECQVERRIPRRALVAAALWHIAFLTMPFPQLPASARHYSAFDNTELTWSGPISDVPLLELKSTKTKPSPRVEPQQPLRPRGADAFHPRQRIFTDPVHPTHPRQTLVNAAAPMEPPKILPNLPNIVQFQQLQGPARPRLQISEQALAKLKPREHPVAAVTAAPLPDVPAFEQPPAEIAMPVSPHAPARPKLELNAGGAPRVAPRAETGNASPAPELAAAQTSTSDGNPATFIALSATPGPPAPVVPPQGNLAARLSISPEGKQVGAPGGSPNGISSVTENVGGKPESSGGTGSDSANEKGAMDISISGGNPPANNGVSGLAGSQRISAAPPRALISRPNPRPQIDDAPVRTGPPDFAALPRDAQPERIFASKKVYKMLVNMPNLNSATGSWILNFSELRANPDAPHITSSDVAGPAPVRKVDPKYPPTLMKDRVEGEVVLYAVIRRDGSVDSIQLVHGIDEQLDANAMDALSQWKFRPALKQGTPVELEAIVHIPFHAPSDR